MTLDDIKKILKNGGRVCDVGQLNKDCRKWLRDEARTGNLKTVPSRYPDGRPAYERVT